LRGEILKSSRFGVISLHHADHRTNRGGPPGFWEVYFKEDNTGFMIYQLSETVGGGNALISGRFPTKGYFILNRAALYTKSITYLKQLLNQIAIARALPTALESQPYFNPLFKIPNLLQQLRYISNVGFKISFNVVGKFLLKRDYRWGVAYTNGDWKTLLGISLTLSAPFGVDIHPMGADIATEPIAFVHRSIAIYPREMYGRAQAKPDLSPALQGFAPAQSKPSTMNVVPLHSRDQRCPPPGPMTFADGNVSGIRRQEAKQPPSIKVRPMRSFCILARRFVLQCRRSGSCRDLCENWPSFRAICPCSILSPRFFSATMPRGTDLLSQSTHDEKQRLPTLRSTIPVK
jgi:hypothetical protein